MSRVSYKGNSGHFSLNAQDNQLISQLVEVVNKLHQDIAELKKRGGLKMEDIKLT
jgi:hypothetical protein